MTLPTSGITVSGATFSVDGENSSTVYYIKNGTEVTLTLTADYLSSKNAVDVRFLEYGQYGHININSRTYNADTTTSIKFNMPAVELTEGIFNFSPVINGLTFNGAGRFYEINDAQDMVDLATYIASSQNNFGYGNTGGEYLTFKLMKDIDMSSVSDFHGIGTITYYPIAMGEGNAFRGTFDGNNHKISGVNINNKTNETSNPNYAGLFSWICGFSGLHGRSQAVIKNLIVENPQVIGGNAVGGIAGLVGTDVLFENCTLIGGNISGNNYSAAIGGIAGNCVSTHYTSDAAHIKNCIVINPKFEGGSCGALTGRGGYFVDSNLYYLENKGISFVAGGFAGGNGDISPLYKVTDKVGDSITVDNITCDDSSKVEIDGSTYYRSGAQLSFTVSNSDSNFVPAVGSSELLKTGNTYSLTVGNSDVEISSIFKLDNEGSKDNPYIIKNADALNYLAEQVNAGNDFDGKFFKLANDITFDPSQQNNFTQIGSSQMSFKGTFDGDNFTISGLNLNSENLYGASASLFFDNYGSIQNLNVNVNFTSKNVSNISNGICRVNFGSIQNVTVSGSLSASFHSNGICSVNEGSIEGCVAYISSLSGNDESCGIVRRNEGSVINCFNSTDKQLFFRNYYNGSVSNSYSTYGIAITLPTDSIIKVNDGVNVTTYVNGITAYEGGGILFGGKLYLNEGEKVKLSIDSNCKIFDTDLNVIPLDDQGYYTATATADLSAAKALAVKGTGWEFDAETGKLSISSNDAFSSSEDWANLLTKITSVEIGNSVTSIGESAFKDFTALKNVSIGSGVTSIGASAFSGCNAIETFTVGGTISTVGSDAFTGSNIKVVSLPQYTEVTEGGVFTVGQNAYVLDNTLVYRYTGGYTQGTSFSVTGASSSANETNEIITLSNITGNVTVTDSPVMLSGNEENSIGADGANITWEIKSTGGATNNYLIISGNGAIKDFTDASSRPEGFTTNLSTIKKVYIGSGVTHIGENIFAGMNLSEVSIATKYYSGSTYEVAPTYQQVSIADNAFGSGTRIYRIDLPVNAYVQTPSGVSPAYKVISNYKEGGANTWYISSSANPSVTILTPEGYNLVDKNNSSISRTLSIQKGNSTYAIAGTSSKVWEGGGDTEEEPYVIKDTAGLQLIAETAKDNDGFSGKYFKLADNIEDTLDWGGSISTFKGTFDGNGKTVKANGSLFSNNVNGTIKNLTISNDSSNANFANENGGTIDNCTNNSANSGTGFVGGIVNDNSGNVTHCKNNGNVTCTDSETTQTETREGAGGIVGVQRSGSGSVTDCENFGTVNGTSYVGGIIGNMQGGQSVKHNFNGGAITGTSYIGGIIGNQSGGNLSTYSPNYYGGSCTTGGVNGEDADGAKRGYKLVFTTAGKYADETEIESMLVGVGDNLSFNLTKGYKVTGLTAEGATFDKDYKLKTTSTAAEIAVTATVDLDAVNLTAQNSTTEITSQDTKTIRVNGEDKLNFISGREYYTGTPINLNGGKLEITGSGIEIPAEKNSNVSKLNVIDARADINGTDEVDNVTVSNFTLQSGKSEIALNGGEDTLTVQNSSVVSSDFNIDGGANNDKILVQNITVESAIIENQDSSNGGYLNVEGGAGNDVIEVQQVKYNLNDTFDRNDNLISGGEGDDSIAVTGIEVEGLSRLTIEGGEGNDTITVANISGEGIVTIEGGEGADKIEVEGKVFVTGGGNFTTEDEVTTFTADKDADKITIGDGATVEAGAKDIITVKQGTSAVINYKGKSVTVKNETGDAVFEVTENGLTIANNFDGEIEGDDLTIITDNIGGKSAEGKKRAFISGGIITDTIIELDAGNKTATLAPYPSAYNVKIADKDLGFMIVTEETKITANFEGSEYKTLDVAGGKVNVILDAAKTKPINFKDKVKAAITDTNEEGSIINWKEKFSVESGSTVEAVFGGGAESLNYDGVKDLSSEIYATLGAGNDTITIKDTSVKDGGYIAAYGGEGNNKFIADKVTVSSANYESISQMGYAAQGGNDTISVSNATLDGTAAVMAVLLAEGNESVSVEGVSIKSGVLQISGNGKGKDTISVKNITAENANLIIDEAGEFVQNTNDSSANIGIEEVTLKGSNLEAIGYNATISAKNVKVDDAQLRLSNSKGDGKFEVDGATVTGTGSIYIYDFKEDSKDTVKLQNVTIDSGYMKVEVGGGDDTISVANISGNGVVTVDGGEGADNIDVEGGNVYVIGGKDADRIIFSGKGSTVDATDNQDVITVKQNANVVLDFGENNFATVTATSADVNFAEGKLQLIKDWSGEIEGNVKLSTLPDTFKLNGKTYTTKTVGAKKVLTYVEEGITYLYDGEFDFENATTADLATEKWIPVAFVTVTDKTFELSAPNKTVYIVDEQTLDKYAKLEVTGEDNKTYSLVNVEGNAAVRDMTIDISKFGKDISIESNGTSNTRVDGKSLNDVHIKTSAATFQVESNLGRKVKIGSDGKFLTNQASYVIESSTGNLSAVADIELSIKAKGEHTVNGKTYTTNKEIYIITTADSSHMVGGTVILKNGESVPVDEGTISVSGDTDGVEILYNGGKLLSITGLSEGGVVTHEGTTYTRTGNEIVIKTSDEQTIYNYDTEKDLFDVSKRGDGFKYVKVEGGIKLTGEENYPAIYGTEENYSPATYLAKLEKIVVADENYDEHTYYELTKREGLTEQLKITVDDGKNLTANFDAEVTATGSVTINDKVYTAAKDSLTIVTGENSSTLTGGTIELEDEVKLDGGKSMKFTGTDDVKTLDVTITENVIKDFNVTAGKFEILGTENADNINVTGAKVASDNLLSISGGAGDDVINLDDVEGVGVATIEGGEGADNITVGNGALVKADSADTVTVKKNKSAVIQLNDKKATITAVDVDAKITFEGNALVIADGWKGNIISNAPLKLSTGTFTLNGTAYKVFDNGNLINTSGEGIKLYIGELSDVTADNIAATSTTWQSATIIEEGKITFPSGGENIAYLDDNGNKIADYENQTLTIYKDKAANLIVEMKDGDEILKSFKVLEAEGNVTVTGQGQISGAKTIRLTKGDVEIGGENILTGGENSEGVTIGITDGKATAITGLNDDEFVDVHVDSTGHHTVYKREGTEIIREMYEESRKTTVYTVGADEDPNVLSMTGGADYVEIKDGKIDLTEVTTEKIYGKNDSYDANNYFAKLTVEDGKYTLTKRKGAEDLEDLQITLDANQSLDAQIAATVKTAGYVTINGVSYNAINEFDFNGVLYYMPNGEIEIAVTKDSSSVINGTVQVTYERFGVKVKNDNDGVYATFKDGEISAIKGLSSSGYVEYEGKTYKRKGNTISLDGKVYEVTDDTDILHLSGGTNYVNIMDTINLRNITEKTLFFKENAQIAEFNGNKLTISGDDTYTVKIAGTVKIGATTYNAVGTVEISASKESSSIVNGTVSIKGEQYGVEVTDDTDGVEVTFADRNITAIKGLNAGGTVKYDGTTYTRTGDYIFLDGKVYTVTDTKDILSLSGGTNYVEVTDTIDLSNITDTTKFFSSTALVAEYKPSSTTLTISGDKTYKVKTAKGNVTIGDTKYNALSELELSTSKNSSSLVNGTVNVKGEQCGVKVENDSDGVNVTFSNDKIDSITGLGAGGSVTYDGTTYTRTGNNILLDGKAYEVADSTDILKLSGGTPYVEVTDTIDLSKIKDRTKFFKDSAQVAEFDGTKLKISGDDTFTVKTSGTVIIGATKYNAVGTVEISASKTASSIVNGTVNVTDEQFGVKVSDDSDGVVVTVADGAITSITGLNDGGVVTYEGKTYTRKGDRIFFDGKFYTATDATNILKLSGGTNYVEVTDTIDLNHILINATTKFFSGFEQIAVFNHRTKTLTISDDKTYTVVTSKGTVTIGDITYNAVSELEIVADKDSSSVINGIVKVTDEQQGVKVTNDSDGVEVTFKGEEATSITGLNDGGSVEYDGKTYTRTGNSIFLDGKIYDATDDTDILNLSGDVNDVEVTDTIDLRNISDTTKFFKDSAQVAVYNSSNNILLISGNDNFTVKISGKVKIDVRTYDDTSGKIISRRKTYDPIGEVEIATSKNSSKVLNGTVKVEANRFGVRFTNDSDGVEVTFADKNITSITGLNDGGSVEYDGKTYLRTGDYLFEGGKVYSVTDDTNILGFTDSNALFKIEGVTSLNGLTVDTDKKVIKVSAAALNEKVEVKIEGDGYTLALADDVIQSTAQNPKWTLDGSTATYKANTTAGYTLNDNKISYVKATEGATLIEVDGVTSLDGLTVNGKVVTVSADSLGTEKEVKIEGDGYTLALADDVTQSTEQNPKWTIDGSTATYKANTTAGYTLNDNKISYVKATEGAALIEVDGVTFLDGLTVNGKVVTVSADSLGTEEEVNISDGYTLALADDVTQSTEQNPKWTIDGSTATYKANTTAGYTLQDNKISYVKATEGATLIEVDGVTSLDGLTVNGKVVTVSADSLGTEEEVNISDGYTLALGNDVIQSTEETPSWTLDGSTATYKANTTAGYTLNDNKISYVKATEGKTLIEVDGVTSLDGLTLNGKVVTVSADSLGTEKEVNISDGYTLALGNDVTQSTEETPSWTLDGSTATYKATTTAGYTLNDNKISYSPQIDDNVLITVTGVDDIPSYDSETKILEFNNKDFNTITVNGVSYTIKGTFKISLGDSSQKIINGGLQITSDNSQYGVKVENDSDGVIAQFVNSKITSITGLDDGGSVEYNGTTYLRKGNYIFEGDKVYNANDNTNILSLKNGKVYKTVSNSTIELNGITQAAVFFDSNLEIPLATLTTDILKRESQDITSVNTIGYNKTLKIAKNKSDNEITVITSDGTFAYNSASEITINSDNVISGIKSATIYSGGIKCAGGINIKPSAGVEKFTVNGVTFNTSEGNVLSDVNSAYAVTGTFAVTDSLNLQYSKTLTVSDDSDGVIVELDNKNVTSIKGLNAGGSVTYNGKNYFRKDDRVLFDGKIYNGNDDTNLLAMTDGTNYVEVTDTIDLSNITAETIFLNKDSVQVAIYKDGELTTDGGNYTIKTSSAITVDGVEFNSASTKLTIESKNGNIYLHDGSIYMGDKLTTVDDKTFVKSSGGSVIATIKDGIVTDFKDLKGVISGDFTNSISVNSKPVKVENDTYISIESKDGTNYDIKYFSNGAVLKSFGNTQNVITDDSSGTFTIGKETFKIRSSSDVTFKLSDSPAGKIVSDVSNLKGTLTSSENQVTVNGYTFGTSNTDASIVSTDNGQMSMIGLSDGDAVTISTGATVEMPGTTESDSDTALTVNGKLYVLENDSDGVVISEGTDNYSATIVGLDANASLAVGAAGTYNVNGELLNANAGDVIIGDEKGSAYIWDENDFSMDNNTSVEDIVNKLAGGNTEDRYTEKLDSEQSAKLVEQMANGDYREANGNIEMTANNTDSNTTQDLDFSNTTGIKIVSLEGGNQNVKFNDSGKNVAIISKTSGNDENAEKNITFGDGGDMAIVEDVDAQVNITFGKDPSKVVSEGKNVHFKNYDPNTGSGIQTDDNNISDAVKNGSYGFDNNNMNNGNGKVNFEEMSKNSGDRAEDIASSSDSAENTGSLAVNLYNRKGEMTRVGWTYQDGGDVDLSSYNGDALLLGNYTDSGARSKSGSSNLYGGNGTNNFLAGANDNVYLGTGQNNVDLSENRSDGADIYAYDELIGNNSSGGNSSNLTNDNAQSADATGEKYYSTVVEGFQFGFDDNSDVLHISGESSSRSIKQNYIEPLKEMFNSLVDDINNQEDSTEESADLAESVMIVNSNTPPALNVKNVLRPSNRNVDLISQALIGVNTPALSTQIDSLQSRLSNSKIKLTSTNDNTTENNSTSTTPSTTDKSVEIATPSVKDAVPEMKKSKKGDVTYKDSVKLKASDKPASSGDAAASSDLGDVDYTKLKIGYEDGVVKTAIAGDGSVMDIAWSADERAEEYVGENSGIDVGEYEGTVAINLNTGVGVLDGDEAIAVGGVDKLKAGKGVAMFVGSSKERNTLMGGAGYSSIWGGGEKYDVMLGYSGDDKEGSTEFFYVTGDGRDIIGNFGFKTGDNGSAADKLNFLDSTIRNVLTDGSDVLVWVGDKDEDVLRMTDAVGKDFVVVSGETTLTAQVGDTVLTYDGRADYFNAQGKNATVKVDGSLQNAEVWLNNGGKDFFTGDIKVLDASNVEGKATLAGNGYDNIIYASKGGSSLWGGGESSNDTLIGGESMDTFFYAKGNGNDIISGATNNDIVNLYKMTLDDISNVEVSNSEVKISFKDYGSLTVTGDTSGLTFKIGDEKYIVNQSTRLWSKK